jgi:hypothetical protein
VVIDGQGGPAFGAGPPQPFGVLEARAHAMECLRRRLKWRVERQSIAAREGPPVPPVALEPPGGGELEGMHKHGDEDHDQPEPGECPQTEAADRHGERGPVRTLARRSCGDQAVPCRDHNCGWHDRDELEVLSDLDQSAENDSQTTGEKSRPWTVVRCGWGDKRSTEFLRRKPPNSI